MRAIILEDEQLAAERLQLMIRQLPKPVTVLASLESVGEAESWLKSNEPPDFILSDIHLGDGLAFDIFQNSNLSIPVIFTTAYDQYALDAFRVFGIDYLLKPVSLASLEKSIDKIRVLKDSAATSPIDYQEIARLFQTGKSFKSRFIGKTGQKLFLIDSGEIVLFNANDKLVYITVQDGTRYITDFTLEVLEKMLDPAAFFRINRSMIVQVSSISQIKPFPNNRLKIIFRDLKITDEAVISRDRVALFRRWADT